MYFNLRGMFIWQGGSTIEISAFTGDFSFSDYVPDVKYSVWESTIIILAPTKEILT